MAGITWGNRVLTTTNQKIMPYVVDTILRSNVGMTRILAKAKEWQGETMKFPIKYQKNTTGTSFQGAMALPTSTSDTRVNMSYTPTSRSITVTLPLDELSYNAGEEKIMDLMALETRSSAQDMADDIGTLFYGTGSGLDFNGLGNIVDDGTDAANIGGLSRTTYTTLKSTVTASGGTLSLAKLRTLWNAISDGSVQPTLHLTTKAVFGFYESLLQPQERLYKMVGQGRNNQKLSNGAGYTTLDYMGVPVLADQKCTSGVWFMINEDFLDFYGKKFATYEPVPYKSVDIEGNDYGKLTGLGFSWSGWTRPTNAASVTGFVVLSGNFVSENPRRHGKLTGITGV